MAPLPGSLAPHRHHIADLTLIGIRLAHTHYYIEEKSVLITLSAVTLQPVNFGQSTEVMSVKFGLPVRARLGFFRGAPGVPGLIKCPARRWRPLRSNRIHNYLPMPLSPRRQSPRRPPVTPRAASGEVSCLRG